MKLILLSNYHEKRYIKRFSLDLFKIFFLKYFKNSENINFFQLGVHYIYEKVELTYYLTLYKK